MQFPPVGARGQAPPPLRGTGPGVCPLLAGVSVRSLWFCPRRTGAALLCPAWRETPEAGPRPRSPRHPPLVVCSQLVFVTCPAAALQCGASTLFLPASQIRERRWEKVRGFPPVTGGLLRRPQS